MLNSIARETDNHYRLSARKRSYFRTIADQMRNNLEEMDVLKNKTSELKGRGYNSSISRKPLEVHFHQYSSKDYSWNDESLNSMMRKPREFVNWMISLLAMQRKHFLFFSSSLLGLDKQ